LTTEQTPVFSPSSECHRIFLNCKSNFIIFGGGAGCGKALKHGEKVLTPSGFKNIEDMQVGDDVITPNNTIEKVTGVFPQGEVDIYKVVFQDGTSVETCGEHLWQYSLEDDVPVVGNTSELLSILRNGTGTPKTPLVQAIGDSNTIAANEKFVREFVDQNGFVSSDGSIKLELLYYGDAEKLAYAARSLGYSVKIVYEEHYVTVSLLGTDTAKLFSDKADVVKPVKNIKGNEIIAIEKAGRDLATCIAISGKDKLFITTNFVVTHNTHQALMLILKYKDDPNFRAVFIRETSTQLSQAGGLFQEAQAMWKYFGAVFKYMPNMSATFPSGAQVQFKVCGADRDISNYDGGQYSLVVFDEAQNHSEVQVRYLESRIRSKAKGPHQLIATCNPKFNSWLLPFVHPYLDPDTGIPNPDMFAREMYYGSYNGKIVIGRSKEELIAQYPDVSCQSYTFIAATIADNPIMRRLNPEYVKRLEGLKRVERERLLLGSWFAKENNSSYFKRDWVEIIEKPPTNALTRVRGMDFAATLPSESNPNPDWTASVLVSRTPDYYVIEHVERYRKLTNGVLEHIVETAKSDRGYSGDVPVYFPKDPGAAGAQSSMFFIKYLVEHGVIAKAEKSSGHSGKLSRAQPFLSLCEAGLVKVVKGEWNSDFFNELEEYIDGKRGQKDDQWDACATAFKAVMKQNTLPSFSLPSGMTQASPIPTIHN